MSELIYEQALDALETVFGGIVGNEDTGDESAVNPSTGFWYTPSVVRTHGPVPSVLNDSRSSVIYAIWPEDIQTLERASEFIHERARFFLLVAKRHPREDRAWREAEPKRNTVQNRLIRDVKRRLAQLDDDGVPNIHLGGLVDNTEIRTWIQSTRQVHFPLWALALGRGQMEYETPGTKP